MKKTKLCLAVGTRKGAFFLRSNARRRTWDLEGPLQLGAIVNHVVLDPRDGRTMLMAAKTGHLGPTVYRSDDAGGSWKEATKPPAFDKAKDGEKARAVDTVFWLTPGHAKEPRVWYAGTCPHGLFRTEDAGATWQPVRGFNDYALELAKSRGAAADGTPDGPITHSILVDPRDAKHMYIGLSAGGLFESTDAGAMWRPLNRGVAADFLPDPSAEIGHDPHQVVLHPADPDRLYQQNHCGIYRLDRPGDTWKRIGVTMPREVGDIGFPIVPHPRDVNGAWVFPMDGTSVWPRTSPDGKPAVYRTRDGGRTWKRQARGLPDRAWYTVKRQAFCSDLEDPLGLYFGTTSGEIWMSAKDGRRWKPIAQHLPHVYSVSMGYVA